MAVPENVLGRQRLISWKGFASCIVAAIFVYFCIAAVLSRQLNYDMPNVMVMNEQIGIFPCSLMSEINITGQGNNIQFHPKDCSLHTYTRRERSECLAGTRVLFLGDSKARRLYVHFTKTLIPGYTVEPKSHKNNAVKVKKLRISMGNAWTPMMNQTKLQLQEIVKSPVTKRPNLLFLDLGIHDMIFHNGVLEAGRIFTENMTDAVQLMKLLIRDGMQIIWLPLDFANLTHPCYGQMKRKETWIEFEQIARNLLNESGVLIWETSFLVAERFKDGFLLDCVHRAPIVHLTKIHIFLNWWCNKNFNFTDGTCCAERMQYSATPGAFYAERRRMTEGDMDLILPAAPFIMIAVIVVILAIQCCLCSSYGKTKDSKQADSSPMLAKPMDI